MVNLARFSFVVANYSCLDIYIAVVGAAHAVCPKGYYVAIVSTIAEGQSNHHLELQPGIDRLGRVLELFQGPPIPLYEPLESGQQDKVFISKSYDATSHFETTTGSSPISIAFELVNSANLPIR
jgi:RAB protein geranylgeranyltransferase component A